MKRLVYSLSTACVAAVMILAGNSTVDASDKQTLDPARNTAEKEPDTPTQDDSQKVTKSGLATKVNVDSHGVIVTGYDVVAYFKQGEPAKGESRIREHISGCHILVCLVRG